MNNTISYVTFDLVTPQQELLLKAALLSGEEALDAWRKWQDKIDWEEHLDQGSFRLLPLIYTNLHKHGVDDPAMGMLKGIYRKAWSKNQTLFHEMAKVVEYLQYAGIKTMLLKGASLSLLYYKNNGARPMADIDVLVPFKQARQACELLQKAGWTSILPLSELDFIFGHAVQLKNSLDKEFDLHWRPFNSCCDEYEKDFWNGAMPVKMANVNSLAPNPTNMLFHVIIHGMAWNPVPSIRWIADAITLINSDDFTIDWQQLINMAKKHYLSLRLKSGLQYLYDNFHPSIPSSVMKSTGNLSISYLEKIEYGFMIRNRDKESAGPYTAFCCHLCRFRRLNSEQVIFPIGKFARSLQWRMNARNGYDLLHKGFRLSANMFFSRPFQVRHR
ncbi:MAG: nucleotidyltransferase family protein [Smithella sp.]|nr:nucleotidyltransferase family protein [Smithella sp.]